MKTITVLSAMAIGSLLAFAGTACPDPYTYHITNGQCVFTGCVGLPPGGYIVTGPSETNGGCMTPGNSAYTCTLNTVTDVATYYPNPIGPFVNGCGDNVYGNCGTQSTYAYFGITYGQSTTTPCNYGGGGGC